MKKYKWGVGTTEEGVRVVLHVNITTQRFKAFKKYFESINAQEGLKVETVLKSRVVGSKLEPHFKSVEMAVAYHYFSEGYLLASVERLPNN